MTETNETWICFKEYSNWLTESLDTQEHKAKVILGNNNLIIAL
jgi:hypothetical protein